MTLNTPASPKKAISRRNFFKLVGGGVAAAVIAPYALAKDVIRIPVEFGWTWYVDKTKVPDGLSEIITTTLRNNTQKIAENIDKGNALLAKLAAGDKVLLEFEKISPEEQSKRMVARLEDRQKRKQELRLAYNHTLNGRIYEYSPIMDCFYEDLGEMINKRLSKA